MMKKNISNNEWLNLDFKKYPEDLTRNMLDPISFAQWKLACRCSVPELTPDNCYKSFVEWAKANLDDAIELAEHYKEQICDLVQEERENDGCI